MKLLILILLFILVVAFVVAVLFGMWRTLKTQSSDTQQVFLKGKVPKNLPEGLYKGTVTGYNGSWKGKSFDPKNEKGINMFSSASGKKLEERYPFKLSTGKGIQDKDLDVIKIDYNIAQNPLWLRFILDEIVETSPNKFLGKLHVRILPNVAFSLGYFSLTK